LGPAQPAPIARSPLASFFTRLLFTMKPLFSRLRVFPEEESLVSDAIQKQEIYYLLRALTFLYGARERDYEHAGESA